jgi:hypothetical protein
MLQIKLSSLEKNRILHYAEKELYKGHWGNGELILPEHQFLMNVMKSPAEAFELSPLMIEVICSWISEATNEGRFLSQEDVLVIRTLLNQLNVYRTQSEKIEDTIEHLNKILSITKPEAIKKKKTSKKY